MWGRAQEKKKKKEEQMSRGARSLRRVRVVTSLSILFFPPLFAFGYESEVHAIVLDPQDKSRSVYYKSKVWVGKRGAPGISKKKRERRERRKVVGRGRKRKRRKAPENGSREQERGVKGGQGGSARARACKK